MKDVTYKRLSVGHYQIYYKGDWLGAVSRTRMYGRDMWVIDEILLGDTRDEATQKLLKKRNK